MNDIKSLEHILSTLEILHDELAQIIQKHNSMPLAGSQAEREIASPFFQLPSGIYVPTGDNEINPFLQANILIESAADHLIALRRVFTIPVLTLSPWTCIRAILESSATASWLLNPKSSGRDRIKKSFAIRFADLTQQKAFANAMGNKAGAKKVDDRIAKIEGDANLHGFTPVVDSKNRRIGLGQKMPELTNLVKNELDQEVLYRASSGVIHGNMTSLRQLGFQNNSVENVKYAAINLQMFEKKIDFPVILDLCNRAALSFARPNWYRCQLFGWDQTELDKLFNKISDTLNIQKEQQFWNP